MTLDAAAVRAQVARELRARGKKAGDAWLQRYVGSPHPVLGLTTAQARGVQKSFFTAHPDLTAKEVNALAAAMWKGTTLEEKWFAMSLLDRYTEVLDAASWKLLDRMAGESVGWGMCDSLGSGAIAKVVHREPARLRELWRWATSDNFWRRRVALYALHDFVLAKELDKPLALLERLLYDEEFWVQRAVGTWLRECWKRDRKRTEAFLRKHVRGLPKVVITVATERAPKAFREELRRNRGPDPTPPRSPRGRSRGRTGGS